MTFWRWMVSWLVWLSADPVAIDLEAPKAAAAVAVARASMVPGNDAPHPVPPAPAPVACDCGQTCVRGTWKPDGKIPQVCKCQCPRCVAERAKASPTPCPDGTCPPAKR